MESIDGKDLLIRELKRKIRSIEAENTQLHVQLNEKKKECEYVRYCLDETRKSFSYRLGYAITAVPRKLKRNKCTSEK